MSSSPFVLFAVVGGVHCQLRVHEGALQRRWAIAGGWSDWYSVNYQTAGWVEEQYMDKLPDPNLMSRPALIELALRHAYEQERTGAFDYDEWHEACRVVFGDRDLHGRSTTSTVLNHAIYTYRQVMPTWGDSDDHAAIDAAAIALAGGKPKLVVTDDGKGHLDIRAVNTSAAPRILTAKDCLEAFRSAFGLLADESGNKRDERACEMFFAKLTLTGPVAVPGIDHAALQWARGYIARTRRTDDDPTCVDARAIATLDKLLGLDFNLDLEHSKWPASVPVRRAPVTPGPIDMNGDEVMALFREEATGAWPIMRAAISVAGWAFDRGVEHARKSSTSLNFVVQMDAASRMGLPAPIGATRLGPDLFVTTVDDPLPPSIEPDAYGIYANGKLWDMVANFEGASSMAERRAAGLREEHPHVTIIVKKLFPGDGQAPVEMPLSAAVNDPRFVDGRCSIEVASSTSGWKTELSYRGGSIFVRFHQPEPKDWCILLNLRTADLALPAKLIEEKPEFNTDSALLHRADEVTSSPSMTLCPGCGAIAHHETFGLPWCGFASCGGKLRVKAKKD